MASACATRIRMDTLSRRNDDVSEVFQGKVIDGGTEGYEGADGALKRVPDKSLDAGAENSGALVLKTFIGHRIPPMVKASNSETRQVIQSKERRRGWNLGFDQAIENRSKAGGVVA